jgi:hypothetical protein
MTTPKLRLLFGVITCLFFSACSYNVAYLGESLPPTTDIEVFYAARDVKHEHKVIGHLSYPCTYNEEEAKRKIIEKAKAVGADGVIFLGKTYPGGDNSLPVETADAIKFKEIKAGDKN